jgi:putative membrane protein
MTAISAAAPARRLLVQPAMKTTHSIAVSFAILLATACGQDQPAKTANEAPAEPTPVQQTAQQSPAPLTEAPPGEAPAPGGAVSGLTSADVPREGPRAGNAEVQPAVALSDGQILEVVHTANVGEIEQAKLALTKATDARVRGLARMMVQDHTQADKKGMVLAKKDSIDRDTSPTNEALQSDAEGATRSLKAGPATTFDIDYVNTQVREHQAVLDTIDQKLIVSASNPDLKAYLVEVRAAVASHLQHAQDLQKLLQK